MVDFSIVVPTRDRPAQLASCLLALANLDFPKSAFEVIVVDDGGTEPAEPIVRPFEDALDVVVIRQPNAGPAAARNRGAKHAAGRLLAFTDDDCAPAPGWLRALQARNRSFPNALIGGRVINALPGNSHSSLSHFIVEQAHAHYNRDPEQARFFACNDLCVPADQFWTVGGFDPKYRTAEDRDLCSRWILSGHRLVYAPDAIVFHAHALNLVRLWKQHYHYGRGAYQFHRQHSRCRQSGRWLEWRFYGCLLRDSLALRERTSVKLTHAMLLLVQQIANAAGFLAALAAQALPLPWRESDSA